jgi:hypothetical protein
MRTTIPDSVRQVLLKERNHLSTERSKLVADLDRRIGEIDAVLGGSPEVREAVVEAAAAFNTATIRAAADALIASGGPATTERVKDSLIRSGIKVPEDATLRITKALTRTGIYSGHRTKGWTLKADSNGKARKQ